MIEWLTYMTFELVLLLMCGQDPLEAITNEGSNWSTARQVVILIVNMLNS